MRGRGDSLKVLTLFVPVWKSIFFQGVLSLAKINKSPLLLHDFRRKSYNIPTYQSSPKVKHLKKKQLTQTECWNDRVTVREFQKTNENHHDLSKTSCEKGWHNMKQAWMKQKKQLQGCFRSKSAQQNMGHRPLFQYSRVLVVRVC